MLGYVLPYLTRENLANIVLAYAISASQQFIRDLAWVPLWKMRCRRVVAPDAPDCRFSESCAFNFGSASCSLFSIPVPVVVATRPEPQVSRIAAGRVIAAVQNTQPFWNRAIRQQPRCSVSQGVCELPITFLVLFCLPFPAAIRACFFNFIPESFRERLSRRHSDVSSFVAVFSGRRSAATDAHRDCPSIIKKQQA